MIFTDYYKAEKLTDAKTRYDITHSTGEYDYFENLLINKRGFNKGGLSFYYGGRPSHWKGRKRDMAITKGSSNISSITKPDIERNYAYGDIKGTNDGFFMIINEDFIHVGVIEIEIFIARGLRNDIHSLWNLFMEGELLHDIETLRKKAKNLFNPEME